jgi:rhodanese-related sulfurtransferase
MKGQLNQDAAGGRRSPAEKVLRETALVMAVGLVFSLAANQLSPRGLVLTRNYFPQGTGDANAAAPSSSQSSSAPGKSKELQWVDRPQAVQLFHDSHLQQGRIVFVDARDEEHYLGGHVPGAYEFDPYQPEKYFPTVMPACRAAEQIVVYCHGGDCDDSKSAALLLRDVGIPNQKLFIYSGGITDWSTNHQPVETGARNSGNLSIAIQ